MFLPLDPNDPNRDRFLDALRAVGTPYSYGAGRPSDGLRDRWYEGVQGLAGHPGYDCSGLVQAILVRWGLLDPEAADRPAAGLYEISSPVTPGFERLGDLVFWGVHDVPHTARPSHVGIIVSPGFFLGANGGNAATHGDDPRAYVQLRKWEHYRDDLIGLGRVREEFRKKA